MKYPANLCALSDEEQHAIEVDKQRWFLARRVRRGMSREQGEQWLRRIGSAEHREDMTRRLNKLAENEFQQR